MKTLRFATAALLVAVSLGCRKEVLPQPLPSQETREAPPQLPGDNKLGQPRAEGFWAPIVGDRKWGIALAWGLSFALCEVINVAVRQRALSEGGFEKSLWPSYLICAISPLVAVFLARYLMVAVGLSGVALLVEYSLAVSGVVCYIATMRLVQSHPGRRWNTDLGNVTITGLARTMLSQAEVEAALAVHVEQAVAGQGWRTFHLSLHAEPFVITTSSQPRQTNICLLAESA